MKHNIETSYLAPKITELKELGYYQQYVSYDATNEMIAYLTSYGNPFSEITHKYLCHHSNSIVHPTRVAIAIYAYGLNNIQQFGNKLDNALYQSALNFYRHMIARVKKHEQIEGLQRYHMHEWMNLADAIYTNCKHDAESIANRSNPDTKKYDASNGWYSKLLKNKT